MTNVHPLAVIGDPPEHRDHRHLPGVPPYIAPSARIEAFCTVDAGTMRPTTVGDGVWLMKGVHVGHDALIGHDCEIAPHASIGGWVELGDKVRVGMGATIKNRIKIGDGARVGMGAVVIRDVPAGATVVGNPAMVLLKDAPRISSPSRTWTGEVFTKLEESGWEELAEHAAA